MPSGTAPSMNGTGYIGNNSANTRAWNGLIDDVRIYSRVLSETEIQILAAAPPNNIAPRVSAGTDQTVVWPATATLSGEVSDDGFPMPPGTVTTSWSQYSGPGNITFGDANALSTTATFSAPGLYVLQLAASDGQAVSVGSVSVNAIVRPAIVFERVPGGLRLSWQASGLNWRLQSQTDSLSTGLGTNWVDVAGSEATNQMHFNLESLSDTVFFRLIGD